MTDLTTLLRESAPVPGQPLDVRALLQRSQRPSGRRLLAWLGGLAAVVGLAVPIGGGLLAPADRGRREIVLGPEIAPSSTTSTSITAALRATSAASRSGDPTTAGGSSSPDVGARSQPALVPTTTAIATANRSTGLPLTSTTTTTSLPSEASASEYPAARSCVVDDDGLAAGEQRRCRFSAQGKGGASFRSSGPVNVAGNGAKGEVFVTRGRETTRYEVSIQRTDAGGHSLRSCVQFIQSGDLVEVILTAGNDPADATTTTLSAGEGWCW